eukprot:TRINITY_DN26632_c0_g1_i1.p1 TRINITY_DN26632_c0_g1~~TRINITY_DN26632_c0_g1_i1.p1  ORF type:complete len:117 (+),score=13.86 TRINITY_DN26632_c0_g1_i1:49-399(+)
MWCVMLVREFVVFFAWWGFFFFKQKTAYEMQRGLVGSEMCIRDSLQAENRLLLSYIDPMVKLVFIYCMAWIHFLYNDLYFKSCFQVNNIYFSYLFKVLSCLCRRVARSLFAITGVN